MSQVLCVGLVCIDVIHVCKFFPSEDSDTRSLDSCLRRGGNASNNCTVLSELGEEVEFFGVLSDSFFSNFITQDFKNLQVKTDNCIIQKGHQEPISSVILNSTSGSRTIVHGNKKWPELKFEDFKQLDLSAYKWIHFEGRNLPETEKMLIYAQECRVTHGYNYRLSCELEKPIKGLSALAKKSDVVFLGKDYASYKSWVSMEDAVRKMQDISSPDTIVVCTWGDKGAAVAQNTFFAFSKAFSPSKVVDSLGAGDTFCSCFIHSMCLQMELQIALETSCRLAGAKIGQSGFQGLGEIYSKICRQTV